MKTRKNLALLSLILLSGALWTGCEKNDSSGSIDFGMVPVVQEALKSVSTYHNDVVAALVTIVNENGEIVYDKEYLEFYTFGSSFVTKSLKLEVGSFMLSEFMLLDSSGAITWATPLEGSRLAYLVDDPLPIYFDVMENETSHLYPQVIRVGPYNPADFGYVNFNVDFVERFCIGIMLRSYCQGWYEDSLYMMNNDITMPYYAPVLMIFADGDLVSEVQLENGANKVMVPRKGSEYRFLMMNCHYQPCFDQVFNIEELKRFSCENGKMLEINCVEDPPNVIITPEDILKPTIEQGIFGQLTQPPWNDTLDYENYQIMPLIAELYLYPALDDADSSIFAPNQDCYIYPEMYWEPVAIVRSNSSGYFQVPMEEGEYEYMVKTPLGFYVDRYISSRIPGYVYVKDGEVTVLNIHVQPCYWY